MELMQIGNISVFHTNIVNLRRKWIILVFENVRYLQLVEYVVI